VSILDPCSTVCTCRFWKAYSCQCSHLLLLHNDFCKDLWPDRWLQLRHLQSSALANDHENHTTKNNMQVIAVNKYYAENGANGIEVPVTDTACWQPTSGVSDVAHRSVYDLAQETAQNLLKLRDTKKRNLMLGIMVKLNEASKGNLESVTGMSLENVFNNYMTAFIQPTTRTFFERGNSNTTTSNWRWQ
jgi:hypothetical protein